jgi:hypothetical protein
MFAIALAALLASASPDPTCSGPDISVTDLRISVVKGKGDTADRVLITADLTNVGMAPQSPHVAQHAELLRDGAVVASQPLPALQSGVTYPLQFRIFRPVKSRKDPLEVLVRYVLDDRGKTSEMNCSSANDSLQKIF